MQTKTISMLEHAHLEKMQRTLDLKLKEAQTKDLRQGESLTRRVLHMVVTENYEPAKLALEDYFVDCKDFPAFQDRASRYLKHCSELIHAIQTKRNFPGLATLSLSRQQEIHEKVIGHFEELKHNLKHVEKIERDHRLVDMRSTVWVIKAMMMSVAAVLGALLVIDLRTGVLSSMVFVTNMAIDQASTWLVNLVM